MIRRMPDPADIDLDQTDRIADLATIPPGDRDGVWLGEFLSAIPTAAFRVAEKETTRGPDGFHYLLFFLPPRDVEFHGFSVRSVLDVCLSKGLGVAIYPEAEDKPLFILNYGHLWSYKTTGAFDARPPGELTPNLPPPAALGPGAADRVTVGAPSESYFPSWARNVVREYLKLNGVGTPRAALAADADAKRPRSLLFNLYREDYPSDEHFRQLLIRLTWYFPPHYAIQPLVKRGTPVDELLEPF